MSIGMISMAGVTVGAPLALASKSNRTVHGMRDVFQDLTTKTAQLLRFDPSFATSDIDISKPLGDSYIDVLGRIPRRYLKAGALPEMRALFRKALQGDANAQQSLHPAMLGIANTLFGHRPGWHVATLSETDSANLQARNLYDMGPAMLYSYQIVSGSTEVKLQETDPNGITMAGYRVAEETALLKILTEESDSRIIFVPGLRSSGKSRIFNHLYSVLSEQFSPEAVLKTNVRDKRNGIGTFTRITRKAGIKKRPLPKFTLIDNTPVLAQPFHDAQRGRFAQCVENYLKANADNKIVLFGGTDDTIEDQRRIMVDLLGNLLKDPAWAASWTFLGINSKQLNTIQRQQVTTGDDEELAAERLVNLMNPRENVVYSDFVSARVPHVLGALREFALIPRTLYEYNKMARVSGLPPIKTVDNLEQALHIFQHRFEGKIVEAFLKAHARPAGYDYSEELLTDDVKDAIEYLPQDIEEAIYYASRESQV